MLLAITAGIRMLRGRRKELGRCNGPQIISILSKGVVYHESRIQIRRNSERVTTAAPVRVVLLQEERSMLSFSGSPLVCNAVLLLMGVIIFMVKQLFCNFSWNRF